MKSLKFLMLGVALCVVGSPLFARSHVGFCFNFGFPPFFQPCYQERVIVAPPPPCYYPPCCPHQEVIVQQYYRPCYPVYPCCPMYRDVIIHRHCCPCY